MTETMVRTQVYLPKDIYQTLKENAQADGITMANQIREALAQYIVTKSTEEKGLQKTILTEDDPIWEMIGMGKDGPEDGSVNHDKYIYARDWDKDN